MQGSSNNNNMQWGQPPSQQELPKNINTPQKLDVSFLNFFKKPFLQDAANPVFTWFGAEKKA